MYTDVLATAGLQDCADTGVCGDFITTDTLLTRFLGVLALIGLWVALAGLATVDGINKPIGTRRGLVWVAVAWLVPLVGSTVWWWTKVRLPH